jgi:hypothetical protein
MAPRHTSMRGEAVDMDRLRNVNGDRPAVGNAQVNARGDRLGPGGVVLKTQEQIEAEWAAARAKNAPKPMDIKTPSKIEDALARLAPKAKPTVAAEDANFDPEPVATQPVAPTVPRRRVVDTD